MPVTTRPSEFRFEITQGGNFHLEFPPFLDATTGQPFSFTADPEGTWTARLELRPVDDPDADPVAVFSTSPGAGEGTIELDGFGVMSLDMNDVDTLALTATQEYTAASHGALVGDVVLVDPVDGSPWVWFRGFGQVARQITEG